MLSSEQFRSLPPPPTPLLVEVPEWGGQIAIRRLGAVEGFALARTMRELTADEDGIMRFFVELLLLAAVDGEGKRLLDGSCDRERLLAMDWTVLARIGRAAAEFNGFLAGEDEQKKTTEGT